MNRRIKPRAFAIVLFSFGVFATNSIAEDTASQLSKASITDLIRQLGAASFADREAAGNELVQRGKSATDALEAVLDDPDLEVRLRVQQVLARIAKEDLEGRLTAFVDDVEGKHEHKLPAWKRFQDQMGSGREARELFADMVRVEASFLEALETNSANLSNDFNQRVLSLKANAIPGLQRTLTPASLATLLFIGSTSSVTVDTRAGYQFFSHLGGTSSAEAITAGDHSPAMKKLLSRWLVHSSTNNSFARNGLMLAQRYKLNDVGLQLARTLLGQKNAPSYVLPYAILAVGQFGEKKDGALLERLLGNATVCHTWHNPKFKEVIRIQVRDVALATLIHLQGKDPKEFGFPLLRKDPNSLFYVYTLGFPEKQQRDAVLEKWTQWKKSGDSEKSS